MTRYLDPDTARATRSKAAADIRALAGRYVAETSTDDYDAKVHRALMRAAEIAAGDLNSADMSDTCLGLMIRPLTRPGASSPARPVA